MKENEIRPKELHEKYLSLCIEDAKHLDRSLFETIDCPACRSKNYKNHLTKNEYIYVKCDECGTVFCNPRPSESTLENFYEKAESSKFWSTDFFPAVAEPRREKLFKPKAERIFNYFSDKDVIPQKICDVGSGYGIFLEELKKFYPTSSIFGIEPSPEMAEISSKKGIETLNATSEKSGQWKNQFDLVISSEVIEHVFSVREFILSIYNLVKPGGYCLLTGLGYDGFDILMLQERSNSIFPPHHLNFMSVEGFQTAFEDIGFVDVDVLTPGELDVDIVMNSGIENEFIKTLRKRGSETIKQFQVFLQKNKLSSHVWVIAKKK